MIAFFLSLANTVSDHTNAYIFIAVLKDRGVCDSSHDSDIWIASAWLLSLFQFIDGLLFTVQAPKCCGNGKHKPLNTMIQVERNNDKDNDVPKEVRWVSLAKRMGLDAWECTFKEALMYLSPVANWTSLDSQLTENTKSTIYKLNYFHWTKKGINSVRQPWPSKFQIIIPRAAGTVVSRQHKEVLEELGQTLETCVEKDWLTRQAPDDYDTKCWQHKCVRRLRTLVSVNMRKVAYTSLTLACQMFGQGKMLRAAYHQTGTVPSVLFVSLTLIMVNFICTQFGSIWIVLSTAYDVMSWANQPEPKKLRTESCETLLAERKSHGFCEIPRCDAKIDPNGKWPVCDRHWSGKLFANDYNVCWMRMSAFLCAALAVTVLVAMSLVKDVMPVFMCVLRDEIIKRYGNI